MSNRMKTAERHKRLARIIERDGDRCWFCNRKAPEGERSLYHLRSHYLGGTNQQTNQVMTCQKCALGACDTWPLRERIEERNGQVAYRAEATS